MMQQQNEEQYNLPNYTLLKCIGSGSFANIHLAYSDTLKKHVAVKIFNKYKFDELNLQYIKKEATLLKACKNPAVVHFHEQFEDEKYIYFVLELCDGDLSQIQDNFCKGLLSEKFALFVFKQVLQGLSYLHQNQIIHRDLKVENIFYSNPKNVPLEKLLEGQHESVYRYLDFKIGDLGISKRLSGMTKTQVGSPLTMAPEIIMGKPYGFEADMYSLGVLVYFLLYKRYPFYGGSLTTIRERIEKGEIEFPEQVEVSQELKGLIRRMLEFDQGKRIRFDELYQEKMIVEEGELINRRVVSQLENRVMYSNMRSENSQMPVDQPRNGGVSQQAQQQLHQVRNQEQDAKLDEFIYYSNILRLIKNAIKTVEEIKLNDERVFKLKGFYPFYFEQYQVQIRLTDLQAHPFYEEIQKFVPEAMDYQRYTSVTSHSPVEELQNIIIVSIKDIFHSQLNNKENKSFFQKSLFSIIYPKNKSFEYKKERRAMFSLLNLYYFLISQDSIYDEKIQLTKYSGTEEEIVFLLEEISDLMERTQLSNLFQH